MERYNKGHQGKVEKSAARGQTIRTPLGKDSSDWSGKAADEVPAKLKMGGGMNNLSHTIPGKD